MNQASVPGELFFGREKILADMIDALSRRFIVLLSGERRMGKTATLAQLRRQLPASMVGVPFDLQGCGALSLRQVLPDLALSIAAAADLPPPEHGVFDEEGVYFASTFLPQVYGALGAGRCLVLLLDQLDQIDGHGGGPLLRYLGRLAEWEDRLRFVYAAARLDVLSPEVQGLMREARPQHLPLLEDHEARCLLARARPEGAPLSGEAEGAALRLCGGHPYLLHLLCLRLREAGASMSAADIEAAGGAALRAGDTGLEWLWGGLSQGERLALSAVAELTIAGPGVHEDEVAERLRGDLDEVGAALLRLKDRELLSRAAGHYRLRAGLLRAWVSARKPLGLLAEAAAPPSVADALYGSAVGLRRQGDPEAAAELLQHALRADPRHLPARLLRGEILAGLGRWAGAIEVLEEAGEQGRVLLVRALLARAAEQDRAGDEGGALGSVEQALALSPAEVEAQERRRELLVRRGDAALLAGDLDRAAAAYGQAGVEDKVAEIVKRRRRRKQDELAAAAQEHVWQGAWARAVDAYEALRVDAEGEERERCEEGLARAREELKLAEGYDAGEAAYVRGDMEQAARHFAGVLHSRPGYREVASRLHLALGGEGRREVRGRGWLGVVCVAVLVGGVLGWWVKPAKRAEPVLVVAKGEGDRALIRAQGALLSRRWAEAEEAAGRVLQQGSTEARAVAVDVKERAARGREAEVLVGQMGSATPEEVVRMYRRLPEAHRAEAEGRYTRALSLYTADRMQVLEGARGAGRCAEYVDGMLEVISLEPEGAQGREALRRGCLPRGPAARRVAKAKPEAGSKEAKAEVKPKEVKPVEVKPVEVKPARREEDRAVGLRDPF